MANNVLSSEDEEEWNRYPLSTGKSLIVHKKQAHLDSIIACPFGCKKLYIYLFCLPQSLYLTWKRRAAKKSGSSSALPTTMTSGSLTRIKPSHHRGCLMGRRLNRTPTCTTAEGTVRKLCREANISWLYRCKRTPRRRGDLWRLYTKKPVMLISSPNLIIPQFISLLFFVLLF